MFNRSHRRWIPHDPPAGWIMLVMGVAWFIGAFAFGATPLGFVAVLWTLFSLGFFIPSQEDDNNDR